MQIFVEVVSVSALNREVHVGKASVSLFKAIREFNTLSAFALQLTHHDKSGTVEKGEVRLCGKLVASTLELYKLQQLKALSALRNNGKLEVDALHPETGSRFDGLVNVFFSHFTFEAGNLDTRLKEPFLRLAIDDRIFETERFY